jgi:hypothetical protein
MKMFLNIWKESIIGITTRNIDGGYGFCMERVEFIVRTNSKSSKENHVFIFKNFHELDDFLSKYWLTQTDSLSLIVRLFYYNRRPVDFPFVINFGEKFKY